MIKIATCTVFLGKIEGKRRRGWQRMRQLDAPLTQWTQTPADSEGQGNLACWNSWGHKQLDMTATKHPLCRNQGWGLKSRSSNHLVGSSSNQPWSGSYRYPTKIHFISINLGMVEKGLFRITNKGPWKKKGKKKGSLVAQTAKHLPKCNAM